MTLCQFVTKVQAQWFLRVQEIIAAIMFLAAGTLYMLEVATSSGLLWYL
jgi:hypothetical protein